MKPVLCCVQISEILVSYNRLFHTPQSNTVQTSQLQTSKLFLAFPRIVPITNNISPREVLGNATYDTLHETRKQIFLNLIITLQYL